MMAGIGRRHLKRFTKLCHRDAAVGSDVIQDALADRFHKAIIIHKSNFDNIYLL